MRHGRLMSADSTLMELVEGISEINSQIGEPGKDFNKCFDEKLLDRGCSEI